MNVLEILAAIDAEISKLQAARSLLSGQADPIKRAPGRPRKVAEGATGKPRVRLSPEARARIAAAQKKRWAAKKTTAVG